MKVIGSVATLDKDENGEYRDTAYMGGSIVMLNEEETRYLGLLQAAWSGAAYRNDIGIRNRLQSENMSDAFKAVHSFVDAKFAVNEFREMIDRLDNILLEKNEE